MESTESLDLDFQKLWLILKRRWLPATGVFSLIVGLTVVAVCLQKPDYEAEGKLLIKKADQTSILTGLGQGIGDLEGLNLQSNPVNTEIEVVRSIPLLQKTIAALNLKDKDGTEPLNPENLQKQLKLKNIGGTDVLQLSYKSNAPEEAAAVINKLMSLYIENNLSANRVTAVAAGDFIAKQLPETEATVRQAEAALRRFKEQNHIVDLVEEGKAAIAVLQNLESQITQTQAALADANTKSASLQKQVGMSSQNGVAVNTLNQSAGVQQVLGELQKVEGDLAVLRTKFLETHPDVEALKNKKAALKALLQERVGQSVSSQMQVSTGNLQIGESRQRLTEEYVKSEVERLGLASQLASLLKNQSIYKQQLNIAPKLEQQQREVERRLKVAQTTYEILLQKLQEVRVAENQNMGNASVIESALVDCQG